MNWLVTADWQTDWSNLDTCKTAWKEVLSICQKRKLEGIVVCGDLKSHYNPVDIRVTKWWLQAIHKARKLGLRVIIVNGNHDRIGQYTDAQNWLPILARAGAETFDKPSVADTNQGFFFILPYNTDVKELKRQAENMRALCPSAPDRDVLLFHADIKHSKYNLTGSKSEGALEAEDLHPDRYRYCIGGHIHLHQKIGKNVYYVGSPFCSDWGESNQGKGYIVVSGKRIEFVRSAIPGWFDESWPGFRRSDVTKGSRVRLHVECKTTRDYVRVTERARRVAARKYPECDIYVQPEFTEDNSNVTTAITGGTDRDRISAYLKGQTGQTECRDRSWYKMVERYLSHKLRQVSLTQRSGTTLEALYAKAKNFLSFKDLFVDYRIPGITVVKGDNRDTGAGRSNGAGKTAYLQPIPVAAFGRTFKRQTYDKWANRHTTGEESWDKFVFRDGSGRLCKIIRGRRPSSLKLEINGVDHSSGLRGSAKDATQGQIEQITGFTWQTLANAIYIDESVSRAFLSGTKKERTEVISRFQNLERFELGLKLIRKDKQNEETAMLDVSTGFESVIARLAECRDGLKSAKRTVQSARTEIRDKWHKSSVTADKAKQKYTKLAKQTKHECKRFKQRYEESNDRFLSTQKTIEYLEYERNSLDKKLADANQLSAKGRCPTCGQKVYREHLRKHSRDWRHKQSKINKRISVLSDVRQQYRVAAAQAESEYDTLAIELQQVKSEVDRLDQEASFWGQRYKDQIQSNSEIQQWRDKIIELKTKRSGLKNAVKAHRQQLTMLDFCEHAFSRDGLPAYLNAQLCPTLNHAAAYYSELFCNKAIQLRFEVSDGEFETKVVNAKGGEQIEDQSRGERALAGLITSFTLREVAPKCNVLILDEPGDGLDPVNARKFAASLVELNRKFKTIILTTFNENILSELSDARIVTVRKHKGISEVVA